MVSHCNFFFKDVADKCKTLGINALHIRIRATGGNKTKTPGPGGQSALRSLARAGMKIGRIEVSGFYTLIKDYCITGRANVIPCAVGLR